MIYIRTSLFYPAFLMALVIVNVGVQAQVLERVRPSAERVKPGESVDLLIDFISERRNWCGLYIDWGDGTEPHEIRVGKSPDTQSPLSRSKSYKQAGNYVIKVYPGYVSKILNSAPSCKGSELSATIIVGSGGLASKVLDQDSGSEKNERTFISGSESKHIEAGKLSTEEVVRRDASAETVRSPAPQATAESVELARLDKLRQARLAMEKEESERRRIAEEIAARDRAELEQRRREAAERLRQGQLTQSIDSPGKYSRADVADEEMDLRTKTLATGDAEKGDRTRVLADYAAAIRARIRSYISYDPARAPDNPEVIFIVEQRDSGRVVKVTMSRSSGNAGWDAAVERAIWGSSPLPKTADDQVESPLIIAFRPTSSNLSRQDDIDDRGLAYREAAAQESERLAEGVVQRGIREEKEFKQRQLENKEMIRQQQLAQSKDSLNQSIQSRKGESGSSKVLEIDGLGIIASELKPGFYIQHLAAPSLGKALRFKLSNTRLIESVVYVLKRSPGGSSFNYILATGPFEQIEFAQAHVQREGLPDDVWIRPAYKIRPLLLDQQEWDSHLSALVADAQRTRKAAALLDRVGESSDRSALSTSTPRDNSAFDGLRRSQAEGLERSLSTVNPPARLAEGSNNAALTKSLDKSVSIGDFDFNLSLHIHPTWIDETRYGEDRDKNEALLGMITGIPNPIEEIYKIKIPLAYFSKQVELSTAVSESLGASIEVRAVDFKRMAQIVASRGGASAARQTNVLRTRLREIYGTQGDSGAKAIAARELLRELMPSDGDPWTEYLGEVRGNDWFSGAARGQTSQMLGPMNVNVHLFSISTLLRDGTLVLNCVVTHLDGPLAPTRVKNKTVRNLRKAVEDTCLAVGQRFEILEER